MSHQDSKAALFGASKAPAMPSSSGASGATKKGGLTLALNTPATGAGASGPRKNVGGANPLSNEQRAKKIEEARELSAKGMKCLQVSVFQWKADHLMAAPLFEQSSNAYKAAGEYEQARVMMKQCAVSHEAYGAPAPAAIALGNAAKIAQSEKNPTQAAVHFKEAADMWGNHGDVVQCAESIAKAAKELESEEPNEALDLYRRSLDILAPPDLLTKEQLSRVNIGVRDILRDAFKFALRGGESRLKDALQIAQRMVKQFEAFESEPSMCKSMASVTIIQLTMRDVIQAEQTYLQEHLNNKHYIVSNECKVIDKFLMAFKNSDLDLLDEAQKGDSIFFLDAEIQPLARQLSLFSAKARDAKENQEAIKITRQLKEIALSAASTTEAAKIAADTEAALDDEEADLC